jgi:hypothetical protein
MPYLVANRTDTPLGDEPRFTALLPKVGLPTS